MELRPANLLDTLLHKMIMGGCSCLSIMGHVFLFRWVRLCQRFLSGHQAVIKAVLMFGFTTLRSSRYVHTLVSWFASPDLRDDKAHHEGIRILGNLFTCSQSFVEFHFREQPSIHNPLT